MPTAPIVVEKTETTNLQIFKKRETRSITIKGETFRWTAYLQDGKPIE
jgi:hypothetical protein